MKNLFQKRNFIIEIRRKIKNRDAFNYWFLVYINKYVR